MGQIEVDIYGRSGDQRCGHACGPRIPSSHSAWAAAESLRRLYGDAVSVRYHDLDDPAEREEQAELLAMFEEEGWPLPVTLLNGQLLFTGRLKPDKLVAAVAGALETRTPVNGFMGTPPASGYPTDERTSTDEHR